MTKYNKVGNVSINGKSKILYSKEGTTNKYITYKGRKMNIIKYKKMLNNKAKKH
jgi:hypothetical protein